MMDEQNGLAGFLEHEHTADWELEVWAPDLPALLQQAALGMYTLSGIQLEPGPRQSRSFQLEAADRETLLVSFLEQLLYMGEMEGLGFDEFEIDWNSGRLRVELGGAPIESQAKEIKAVTYHNLEIRETERGLEANLVFDV
jgi:SHS2 domain-containing protein